VDVSIVRAYRTTRVVVAKRVHKIEVPDEPCFDPRSLDYFRQLVSGAQNYLEYGSGGSTLMAHRYVRNLVSVESDRRFLRAVQRRLERQEPAAETTLIHVNIGITEHWGKPVFTKPTSRRLRRWRDYARAPWNFFRSHSLEPDLILIDGRFRVACALESLLNLSPENPCRILVDDYASRPEYQAVEQVADLVEMKGRMAVFAKRPDMDRERCKILVERHYADFR
jgi:hypothetical protein